MKKFLIGLFSGVLLCILVVVIGFFALLRFSERRPSVASQSTLFLKLDGEVPEKPPLEIPVPFLESQTPATTADLWGMFEKAAADSRIKALVLAPRNVQAGWGKLQEIREGLLKFGKSGKPVIACLQLPGAKEYYLATAASRIYLSREDILDLKGIRVEAMFFKNTLDKLGVKLEVEHAGRYKDAGDAFTRTSMTPETREVLNSVLDGVYGGLVQTIAEGRNKSPDEIRAAIDEGPFLAGQALSKGLVDALAYEDEVLNELKNHLGESEIRRISHRDYIKATSSGGGRVVALLVADGTILRGEGSEGIRSESFIRLLRKVGAEESVRAVILRVDSPGGDGIASDEILREVKLLSKKKPLVVSMSDVAASGGYYIAMSGDPVVAYPNTLTGSIGVIFGKPVLQGLYGKLGVDKEILKRGRFADIDSDYQPLTSEGRLKLREGLESMYRSFLARVAEGRHRKVEEIEPLAEGRVWLGLQALENGLIDETGGLDKALQLVKKRAGIPEDETVRLVSYPQRRTIIEKLLSSPESAMTRYAVPDWIEKLDPRLLLDAGYWMISPYTISVR